MKVLSILKKCTLISSIVFFILTILAPIISTIMVEYYHGFIDFSYSSDTVENMLGKKAFWYEIGETYVFMYLTMVFIICFLITQGTVLCVDKFFSKKGGRR